MLFKKSRMLQLATVLVVVAFAFVAGACPNDSAGGTTGGEKPKDYTSGDNALSWGISFNPLTLGLTVGNDTTEINVNWYTTGGVSDKAAKVRFIRGTLAAGLELIEQDGEVTTAGTANTSHKVTVTGLLPGASYVYAVSNDGTNWSPTYDFKVPADTGAFKFAVIADPQLTADGTSGVSGNNDPNSRYPDPTLTTTTTLPETTALIAGNATISDRSTAAGWLETAKLLASKGVSFIASGGDQVDNSGGRESEYDFLYAPPEMRSLPMAPVSGNHDNHLNFNYHYTLPNQILTYPVSGGKGVTETTDTELGRNYFYLYNNILFVVLNTAPYPNSRAAAMPYVDRFDDTLKAATTKFSGKYRWLIVQHHKSTASVADHLADTDIQYYVEAGFEKVMSDYNVDFVLAGHDHVYARSYPLEGRDGGFVSVPHKDKASDKNATTGEEHSYTNPGHPVYLTFTTGSGLKYYAVAPDKTFPYANTVYVKDNASYPYLGDITGSTGSEESTEKGSVSYLTGNFLPVSNAAYVQPYIPSYCIAEMSADGNTLKFSTFAIATKTGTHSNSTGTAAEPYNFDANVAYDWVQVTKN